MSSKKSISRKDFIKNCSATVGLLSLGVNNFVSAKNKDITVEELSGYSAPLYNNSNKTIRGSWLADAGFVEANGLSLVTAMHKCVIVVNDNEHSAVKQAALFLALDVEKITGYKPVITEKAGSNETVICIATINVNKVPKEFQTQLSEKHEAYYIKTIGNNVWLIGSDFRGTAFAVYTLSERLGVDPLYHWTGYQPVKYETLVLKSVDHYSPPPVFKYRGFFNDDEDVLPRPFEKTGYPLRIGDIDLIWYQRYFETALRLRMNMAAPYSRVHRRYEIQKCANEWGLYYTSHHYDVLLSNPFGIERFRLAEKRGVTTEWDWFKNKDGMIKYWEGGVDENARINAIWPVGLRGTDDHAYEFPPNTPADVQAGIFKEAINTQVEIVKTRSKTVSIPLYHFTMYTEMLDIYKANQDAFNVPENVIIVWPDNDDGLMRSLPDKVGKWKHGVYYHLAYFGKDISKQGAHVISPTRIAQEFKKIKDAGATEFLLVNVSEMREHVMEMRMIAELCQHDEMLSNPETDNNYISWWVNEYFGNNALAKQVYRQYFEIFNKADKLWFGNDLAQDVIESLYKKINGMPFKKTDPYKINTMNSRLQNYNSIMIAISSAQKNMIREQRQFFYENVTIGLLADYRPLQAVEILLKAIDNSEREDQWRLIEEALKPLELLETELLRAERKPFEKWYGETWIKNETSPLNYHRPYKQLMELISTGAQLQSLKNKTALGHNIPGAQLWNDYMDAANKIKPLY